MDTKTTQQLVNPFVFGPDPNIMPGGVMEPLNPIDSEVRFTSQIGYPYSDEYDYEVRLTRIDLDAERIRDIENGNGFRITAAQTIKKEVKNEDGMFSSRYGQGLQDKSPFQDRYKCNCGQLKGKIENGNLCYNCGTPVRYVGDNMKYFGWIVLDNHYIIHPNLFNSIKYLIGADRLDKILKPLEQKDQDGKTVVLENLTQEDTFKGIGMIGFYERFDEIINFYANKHKTKQDYYNDIIANRDIVFTHSFPVYTVLLRPFQIKDGHFYFEGSNSDYKIMINLSLLINDTSCVRSRKKTKNELLYEFQMKANHLIKDLDAVLSGKKGTIRGLFGGRFNFTARCVIIPDPDLKVDEIGLPYMCLMQTLQQSIINILQKTYNMTYLSAYLRWWNGLLKVDDIMVGIIQSIIDRQNNGRGIPYLINRNPTIKYGGIMQMYCVKINKDSFAMSIPLQILKPLAADFDGDVLNICRIINMDFLAHAEQVFNPRNAMFISRNTGYVDIDILPSRDTVETTDTIVLMGRDGYTNFEMDDIRRIKEKNGRKL